MKHTYKFGKDLFDEYYVLFKIKYDRKEFGDIEYFRDIDDKFARPRLLAKSKQSLIETICELKQINKAKLKLNKYKV